MFQEKTCTYLNRNLENWMLRTLRLVGRHTPKSWLLTLRTKELQTPPHNIRGSGTKDSLRAGDISFFVIVLLTEAMYGPDHDKDTN